MLDTNQNILVFYREIFLQRNIGWLQSYRLNVSRNSTDSPRPRVVSSPSHITRDPRTMVPTGQPVTRVPSYGVHPAREAIHAFVMVVCRFRSTTVRSAS